MTSRNVPIAVKQSLLDEAGGKCANPGCPNRIVEIHHIVEWHVCKTHNQKHMVAICPACHDAVTRGDLRITDQDAYRWKKVVREAKVGSGHLYIEPSDRNPGVIAGTIELRTKDASYLVNDGPNRHFGFRSRDGELLLLDAAVSDWDGNLLYTVRDGHLSSIEDERIILIERTGRIRISCAVESGIIPDWALKQARQRDPKYAADGEVTLLELEVLEPNLVRLQGAWITQEAGVIVTGNSLILLSAGGNTFELIGRSGEVGPDGQRQYVVLAQPPGEGWWDISTPSWSDALPRESQ